LCRETIAALTNGHQSEMSPAKLAKELLELKIAFSRMKQSEEAAIEALANIKRPAMSDEDK